MVGVTWKYPQGTRPLLILISSCWSLFFLKFAKVSKSPITSLITGLQSLYRLDGFLILVSLILVGFIDVFLDSLSFSSCMPPLVSLLFPNYLPPFMLVSFIFPSHRPYLHIDLASPSWLLAIPPCWSCFFFVCCSLSLCVGLVATPSLILVLTMMSKSIVVRSMFVLIQRF